MGTPEDYEPDHTDPELVRIRAIQNFSNEKGMALALVYVGDRLREVVMELAKHRPDEKGEGGDDAAE